MNILLVNGYQKHDFCKGELNFSLYNIFLNKLRHHHNVQLSSVESYDIIDERNKFLWADLIIFQFPIYWFNVPGKLKLYLDNVFEYGQFYSFADKYGTGGLMKGKEYIISSTWNAPEYTFNDSNEFFNGKSVDEILISFHKAMEFCGFTQRETLSFHKAMEFCGFTQRETLSFHNVVKKPNFEQYKAKLEQYIDDKINK